MILHVSKMAVGFLLIAVMLQEVIFRQLEHDSEQRQQFSYNLIVDMLREDFDLVPVLPNHFRLRPLVCRDKFRDIKDFSIVEDSWPNFSESERFVAVVAAVLEVGAVFEFFGGGELEDLLADGELAVDLFLGEAEVDDVEEALSGTYG
jgi:hypothetical protein